MPEDWWAKDPVAPSGGGNWWENDPAGGGTGPAPPALAGRQSSLRQGQPQSTWSRAWDSVHDWYFGGPDRIDEKTQRETGIGLTPTPSQMADAGFKMLSMVGPGAAASLLKASPILAEEGVAAAAQTAPGLIARVSGWAAAHPKTTGAVVDATPELLRGNPKAAAMDAARGAALGALFQGGGRVVSRLRGAAQAEEALESATASAVKRAPKLKRPDFVEGAVRAPEDPEAYTRGFPAGQKPDIGPRESLTYPAEKPPTPPPPVDRGREAASIHARTVEIAKRAAMSNPKQGQKIWIRFKDGEPIDAILDTEKSNASDLAGAINRGTKRTGESARWFKNLWADLRYLEPVE